MVDRSVSVTLRARVAAYKQGMKEAENSTKSTLRQLTALDATGEKTRRSMTTLGDTAGKFGLAAAAGLALAGKAAVDWESQWAGVTKTVDGSAEQLEALEGELREMARTLPATHQEIAAVAEAAGQLGVATEDVAEFTKTMIALGETTNLTADEAATSIAQMANVMGTAPEDIERVGAALVALGNDGASTEKQIIEMAQRISGSGAQIGLAESDILAIANASASMGVEVEAGGTAISQTFTEMAKATAQGGDDLDKFAQAAGVSAEEFTKAFRDDPAEAFALFVGGLRDINESGGDVFTTLDGVGLSGIRVSQSLLGLAASGDLLTDSLELGAEAWKDNTALAEEFEKRLGTTESKTTIAWNNIKDAGIEMGDVLLPVIAEVAEGVSTMAQGFGKLPGPVQNSVVALGGVVTLLGGGLWAFSKTINGIANMRQGLADLGIQAPKTGSALQGLARNAGRLVVLGAAATALDQAMSALFDTDVSDPDLQRNLDAIANGLDSKVLDRFGTDLATLEAMSGGLESAGEKAQEAVLGVVDVVTLGFGPDDTGLDKAQQNIEQLDQALAAMVESGRAEEATAILDRIAGASLGLDYAVSPGSQITEKFDAYTTALDNAAASSDEVAEGAEGMGAAVDESTESIEAQAEALKESRDAARESAESFVNLGDSLDDGEVGLKGWIRELEKNRKALLDFQLNAQTAASRGLDEGLIASLQEAGEAGALRMGQLADATDGELQRANQAWRGGQRQVGKYVDAIGGVPESVDTKVDLKADTAGGMLTELEQRLSDYGLATETAEAALNDLASGKIDTVQGLVDNYGLTKAEAQALLIDHATGRIADVRARLAALNGTTATTTIRTLLVTEDRRDSSMVNKQGANIGGTPKADGGVLDFYANGGMRENHVAQIAPAGAWRMWAEPETGGEAYIPLAMSKRDRSLEIWAETGRRLGAFAEGGLVATTSPGSLKVDLGDVVLRGTLHTPWGPAQVEGIAEAKAREVMNQAAAKGARSRRRDVGGVH